MTVIATACIVGGCVMMVIFGNHSTQRYTVDMLLDLYQATPYIIYVTISFLFGAFGAFIIYLYGKTVCT